jgi:hypothetical protein
MDSALSSKCSLFTVLVLIFSITPCLPSSAASFVHTADELAYASATVKEESARAVNKVLSKARSVDGIIELDDMLFRKASLVQRGGFTGESWTNGEVFYEFDIGVSPTERANWIEATTNWAAVANLTFIPRTTQPNYIYVQDGGGINNSFVGMIGGAQPMNISSWSSEFLIVHEIGHALGLQHEQSRSDRDNYVQVHYQNILSGREHNFDIRPTVNLTAYDFDSRMHYRRNLFSSNGFNTLEPLAPYEGWLNLIGQQDHLSVLDEEGMAARYGGGVFKNSFLSFPLNADPGWTTEGQWEFGIPQGAGSNGGDPFAGHTGDNVYGYNLNGDYPNLLPETSLTTTALDFSGHSDVELRYWRWLGVESSTWDHACVDASTDAANWITVWENGGFSLGTGAWVQQRIDLSAFDGEPIVYVRWVMGTTDDIITYPGWNIDDIEFRSVGPIPTKWQWPFAGLLLIGCATVLRMKKSKTH